MFCELIAETHFTLEYHVLFLLTATPFLRKNNKALREIAAKRCRWDTSKTIYHCAFCHNGIQVNAAPCRFPFGRRTLPIAQRHWVCKSSKHYHNVMEWMSLLLTHSSVVIGVLCWRTALWPSESDKKLLKGHLLEQKLISDQRWHPFDMNRESMQAWNAKLGGYSIS